MPVNRPHQARAHGDDELLLSVIIISFNTCDLTMGAIASVIGQIGCDAEIIVVDNASTDDSAARIGKHFPQVTLLALPDNIGFGRANNLAAEKARGRYLLLLNPDTLVQPGAIAALLDFAHRRPDARIWGGRTLAADGRLDPRSCARRPSLWSVLAVASGLAHLFSASPFCNPEAMPGWLRDDERGVDIVTGCFLMIGREDWRELGGFDPAYFMYGEEVDLCLRAQKRGAMPAICPSATIIHFGGASQPAAQRMVQILAGRIRYCRSHLPPSQGWLAIWFIRAGVVLRLWLYLLAPARSTGRIRLQQVHRLRRIWWNGYPDHDGQTWSNAF
ncbi:MAG: glycosyltransferase family 2 protein [Rhodobacteraceae bacterium]|nr:glycosyltransferase family 2 protein [Paracoccaceae bacterium]